MGKGVQGQVHLLFQDKDGERTYFRLGTGGEVLAKEVVGSRTTLVKGSDGKMTLYKVEQGATIEDDQTRDDE